MICPFCGGKSHVMRTRQRRDGSVLRFRCCTECLRMFQSVERVETRSLEQPLRESVKP
ncbi:hypothetical protein [Desulfobaculum bizertense]|uniref:Ogr/Delta-like zinc finger n=1 Tax=Desulfobaculum bizertense DSM 18034 TaxID=1121442 RepID=A0A1T4VGS0_9BACT|nr:hypothetical protein [Desulfobaculum bizertense]UIJ37795.1 hypothetical protein LWC08_14045 [Desulfobaculum bizertense]SKA64113.1 hypothetical protein SAMN02745702_00267 [Desulfobaculum bizertense DSM 18034]